MANYIIILLCQLYKKGLYLLSSMLALGLKIFPLYIIIFLGFIASKNLETKRENIAPLIVYILAPAVVFNATYQVKINTGLLILPWILFFMAILICLFVYIATKKLWSDNTRNIVAFSAGTGNTGYFGIPLSFILLSPEAANIYIFALLVSFLYEYTVGFYIISKGSYTLKQSLIKIAKLPVLYAMIAGFTCNLLNVQFSVSVLETLNSFKGAYAVLGMMMIGMGLSTIKIKEIDTKFLSVTLVAKFVLWPILALMIIFIDRNILMLFNESVYQVLIVASIVPMAANTVTLATLFRTKPEQAAIAVLISTIVAFFAIPIMATLFL
ncbi:MAG: AEC family transporter [Campylobacteraceae bacterium]